MFDFTPEIKLSPPWNKYHSIMRLFVYVLFVLSSLYLAGKLFFPSQVFTFSYANPHAKSNTIFEAKEKNNSSEKILWKTYLTEPFSKVILRFSTEKNYSLEKNSVFLRKSYQAFAYPVAEEKVNFKDGTLLKNNSNYYIFSEGKLKKFSSLKVLHSLGFQPEQFLDIENDEINKIKVEEIITDEKKYPSGSLFAIDNTYYQLQKEKMIPFISQNAYNSLYEPKQALQKEKDFLKSFSFSEEPLGFAEGTLLSYANAVYLVEGKKIRPFDNSETFLGLGFDWNDVISASADEIAMYEKDKPITPSSPHPNGTIFSVQENGLFYMVWNGKKKKIEGEALLKSYLKRNPILATHESLEKKAECQLKKKWWPPKSYECEFSLENVSSFFGNEHVFFLETKSPLKIKKVSITFFRDINWNNFKKSLANFKYRIFANY